MLATAGNVHATEIRGIVELEPRSEQLRRLIESGRVNQLRIIAEVTEPLAVCRMLLKIGIEQLGKHFYEVAKSERIKDAREFAKRPRRGQRWWFVIWSNPEQYVFGADRNLDSSIEIIESEGVLTSIMRMPGVSTMVPLEERALLPAADDLSEPQYRVVIAEC